MSCGRGNRKRSESLSVKLTRTYAMLFCAMTLCLSLVIFFVSYEFLVNRQQSDIMANTEIISDLILQEVTQDGDAVSDGMLSELNTNESLSLLIADGEGNIVSKSCNFDVLTGEIPDCREKTVLYTQTDGLTLLCHAEDIQDNEVNVGKLILILRMDREYEFLNMLAWLLIGLNLLGVVAALIVGWVTTRRMLVPINSMIEKARSIDAGLMSVRLDVPEPNDELRMLALTLNEMLDRVERAFIRQGQFTQDASHELRTPLAVLQGNAELLARWGKDDPAVAENCISAITRQSDYMRKLVEALLFIARGDTGRQSLKVETVDVNAFFNEVLDERRDIDAEHVYVALCADNVKANADPTLLRQLLSILLDNAAKYTPEGKRIIMTANKQADATLISVSDEGAGVPSDQLEQIFERFYRLDKARARATGGMGLGLSIARTIVQLHGGTIEARCEKGEGLTVTALFP